MFKIFILVVVFLAVLLMSYVKQTWSDKVHDRKSKVSTKSLKSLILALVITAVVALPMSITSIATGEVGIKTSFGKIVGTNLKEGIQFKAPWQRVIKMNIKVQKYENETSMETSTNDMQMVRNVIVSVNYKLNDDKVVDVYRSVGTEYGNIVLEPAIQEAIKATISNFKAEEIVNKRAEVSSLIEENLNNRVNHYGIEILNISLKNFDFSEEYNDSIEKKTIAEQNALRAQEELEITKAEAEKKRIEAEADAKANEIRETTITEKILLQQAIEKWDGELPVVTGDSGIMLEISSLLGGE